MLPAVTASLPTYWLYVMTLYSTAFIFLKQGEDLLRRSLQQQCLKSQGEQRRWESIDMLSTMSPPPQVRIH